MYARGRKEAHIDTIRYEVDMLDFSYGAWLADQKTAERGYYNAILECFLLHYRNLIEFLSSKAPRKGDLRVTEPEVWAPSRSTPSKANSLVRQDLYDKYWKDLSCYLDHLTQYRADVRKDWRVPEMYGELRPALADFENAFHLRRLIPGGVHSSMRLIGPDDGTTVSASSATFETFQTFGPFEKSS